MIGNLFAPLIVKVGAGIIATLAVALAWLHFVTVPRLENRLEASREAHQTTKANFERAMIEAESKALTAAYEAQVRFDNWRKQSEERRIEVEADYDRLTRDYASRNRVCGEGKTVTRPAGGTNLPAPSKPAERVDGPDRETELVAVSEDDLLICSANTARLEVAQDWVAGL